MGLLILFWGLVMIGLAFVPSIRRFCDIYFLMFWMASGAAAVALGIYYLAMA